MEPLHYKYVTTKVNLHTNIHTNIFRHKITLIHKTFIGEYKIEDKPPALAFNFRPEERELIIIKGYGLN